MRRFDRFVVLVGGVALAAAGALAGIETVLLVLGRSPLVIPRQAWDAHLGRSAWGGELLVTTSGIFLAVGLVLLVSQVLPRRPLRFKARLTSGRDAWVSRRGLVRRLVWALADVDETTVERLRVGRSRIRVHSRAAGDLDRNAVAASLQSSGETALRPLGLIRDLQWRLQVHPERLESPGAKAKRR